MSFNAGLDYEQSLFFSKIFWEKGKTSERTSVSVIVTRERRRPQLRVARASRRFLFIRALSLLHVGAKPPPKCFVSSWVFHIISHYLKSIDSFYTKLGR